MFFTGGPVSVNLECTDQSHDWSDGYLLKAVSLCCTNNNYVSSMRTPESRDLRCAATECTAADAIEES